MSPTDLICRHIYPELISISERDQRIPFPYSNQWLCIWKKLYFSYILCVAVCITKVKLYSVCSKHDFLKWIQTYLVPFRTGLSSPVLVKGVLSTLRSSASSLEKRNTAVPKSPKALHIGQTTSLSDSWERLPHKDSILPTQIFYVCSALLPFHSSPVVWEKTGGRISVSNRVGPLPIQEQSEGTEIRAPPCLFCGCRPVCFVMTRDCHRDYLAHLPEGLTDTCPTFRTESLFSQQLSRSYHLVSHRQWLSWQ